MNINLKSEKKRILLDKDSWLKKNMQEAEPLRITV